MANKPASTAPPLTLIEAMQLFDDIAEKPGYVFNLPKDGCAARAHLMSIHLQKRGINPSKAWAFEGQVLSPDRSEDILSFCSPRGHITNWWYHVAPAVEVQLPDGRVSLQVFDPAMFDGPVDLDHWREYMGAERDAVFVAPFMADVPKLAGWYQPRPSAYPGKTDGRDTDIVTQAEPRHDAQHTRWARKYLDKYLVAQRQSGLNRVIYASPLRQMAEAAGYPVRRKGHGWVSHEAYGQDPSSIHEDIDRSLTARFRRAIGGEAAALQAPQPKPQKPPKPPA